MDNERRHQPISGARHQNENDALQDDLKNDLKYLSDIYGWGIEDKKEIWLATKDNPEMQEYWSRLASAYRQGYFPAKQNHYMRLMEWERRQML